MTKEKQSTDIINQVVFILLIMYLEAMKPDGIFQNAW